jgi:hypothetical protein
MTILCLLMFTTQLTKNIVFTGYLKVEYVSLNVEHFIEPNKSISIIYKNKIV